MALPGCLFRGILPANILIPSHYPLADVVGVEVGHGVAGGVERDDLVQLLRRKTFTAGRAAQAQDRVVALSGAEGVFLLEAVDESRQEAFARSGGRFFRGRSARSGGSGTRRLRHGGTGCGDRLRSFRGVVGEGRGGGIAVRVGVPRVVAGLGYGGALLIVGMAHTAAHLPPHGGIERGVASGQVFLADVYQNLHPFA